jgi:hypothetical protein
VLKICATAEKEIQQGMEGLEKILFQSLLDSGTTPEEAAERKFENV